MSVPAHGAPAVAPGITAGGSLALGRLRSPALGLGLLGLVLAAAVAGALERQAGAAHAADRALVGPVLGLFLPAGCLVLHRRLLGPAGPEASLEPLARWGLSRRAGLLGLLGAGLAVAALYGAALGAAGVVAARGPGAAELGADARTTALLAAAGAATYLALLTAAAAVTRAGRGLLLLADWWLGPSLWLVAVPWPRAHLLNLAGAAPALGMTQGAAWACLGVLGLGGVGAAVLLTRD